MAIGTISDFKEYHEYVRSGQFESAESLGNMFNEGLNGAIGLTSRAMRGSYEYSSFIDADDNVVTRRDITSVSAATDLAPTEDEIVSVKISRKYGPRAFTNTQMRRVASSPEEMAFVIGQDYEERKMKDMLWTTILALEAGLDGQAAVNTDVTGGSPDYLAPETALDALEKFGDDSERIVALLTQAGPWFDFSRHLVATDKVDTVYTGLLRAMDVPSFGRRFGVLDASALKNDNGSLENTYAILGLVAGAAVCIESEPDEIAIERITGLENLATRFQAEWTYNIELKGLKWDVTNGGANPTDATLGTTTNWDKAVSSDRNLPGVHLLVNRQTAET